MNIDTLLLHLIQKIMQLLIKMIAKRSFLFFNHNDLICGALVNRAYSTQ